VIFIAENEQRLEEQLQDVSGVKVELKDKKIKVNELEACCRSLYETEVFRILTIDITVIFVYLIRIM